jgi:ribosomal protein L37AE/L43A
MIGKNVGIAHPVAGNSGCSETNYRRRIMALGLDTDNNCEICGTGSAGMWVCKTCASKLVKPAPSASVNNARDAIAALQELVDLVQAHIDGEYKFDSFSLQPARAVLQHHQ